MSGILKEGLSLNIRNGSSSMTGRLCWPLSPKEEPITVIYSKLLKNSRPRLTEKLKLFI
jgi:hypothetical protein